MEKIKMLKKIDALMKKSFKYLYKKGQANLTELHYSFKMDSNIFDLQMSIQFEDCFADVLVFISPKVLEIESPEYYEAIKACNVINGWVKAFGRFYVDTYGDLAYSLRLNYDFIDKNPEISIKEIEVAIDYYADLFVPLLDICLGKKNAKEMEKYVNDIWGTQLC